MCFHVSTFPKTLKSLYHLQSFSEKPVIYIQYQTIPYSPWLPKIWHTCKYETMAMTTVIIITMTKEQKSPKQVLVHLEVLVLGFL